MSKEPSPPAIPDDASGITLRDVLVHFQHNHTDLKKEFEKLGQKVDAFYGEFREFAKGVDDLDDRVQSMEDEHLPPRMRRVELKLGLKRS